MPVSRYLSRFLNGTPEGIRTPDLLVRSQTLYPAELWVQNIVMMFTHTSIQALPCFVNNSNEKRTESWLVYQYIRCVFRNYFMQSFEPVSFRNGQGFLLFQTVSTEIFLLIFCETVLCICFYFLTEGLFDDVCLYLSFLI